MTAITADTQFENETPLTESFLGVVNKTAQMAGDVISRTGELVYDFTKAAPFGAIALASIADMAFLGGAGTSTVLSGGVKAVGGATLDLGSSLLGAIF